MDGRYIVTLKKFVKSGDKAIVYSHGGRFVAVIEFVGEFFYAEEDIGWTKGKGQYLFPYRIRFKILHESKNSPRISYSTELEGNQARWSKPNLIDDITFIGDKGTTWNQYLQVSVIRITEEDFDTICNCVVAS